MCVCHSSSLSYIKIIQRKFVDKDWFRQCAKYGNVSILHFRQLVPVRFLHQYYPARACTSKSYVIGAGVHLYVGMYIRECGSTLYVGLARAVPPTNFRLTILLTRLQEALNEDLPSLPSLFWPSFHSGSQFLAPAKNHRFLRFIHNNWASEASPTRVQSRFRVIYMYICIYICRYVSYVKLTA